MRIAVLDLIGRMLGLCFRIDGVAYGAKPAAVSSSLSVFQTEPEDFVEMNSPNQSQTP